MYRSEDNSYNVIRGELNLSGVTVWGGNSSVGVVAPYFVEETVTSEANIQVLRK